MRILGFARAWRSPLKYAKLPEKFAFHGQRYRAASNLISHGVPQVQARQIMGQKTASIFTRYNLSFEGDLAEAGRKVTAYDMNGEKKKENGRIRSFEGQPRERVAELK